MGVGAAVAAVALGATVIEKHFTLARADGGVDPPFPSNPKSCSAWWRRANGPGALGQVRATAPAPPEQKSLAFRRSLYAVRDIAAGETLTADNVAPSAGFRACRPNTSTGSWAGRPPARCRGHALAWEDL